MRMAVVLPAPLGRSRTVMRLAGTAKSSPARASTWPKRLRTPSSWTTGALGAAGAVPPAGSAAGEGRVAVISEPIGAAQRFLMIRGGRDGDH